MLFFAHIGLTSGAMKSCDMFFSMVEPGNRQEFGSQSKVSNILYRWRLKLYRFLSKIKSGINPIDYRIVIVGSLLPDIIDKPVFLLLGNQVSLCGHDYAHTLLFNLVLLIGGLVLIGYRKSWLLVISISSFIHLILDQMWGSPVVLFWPLLGPFPSEDTTGWLQNMYDSLVSYPEVYIPEIIGFVILALLTYRLVRIKAAISFIKSGVIG